MRCRLLIVSLSFGLLMVAVLTSCASHYANVKQLIRREEYKIAQQELEAGGPIDAEGWALLASCHFYAKDYPKLAAAAKNSLAISQSYRPQISYYLLESLNTQVRAAIDMFMTGQDDQAIAGIEQALTFSESVDVRMKGDITEVRDKLRSLAAASAIRMENYEQARAQLETFKSDRRMDPDLAERLAYTYQFTEQWKECLAACEDVLDSRPAQLQILNLRANCLEKLGQLPAAVNAYRDALEVEPANPVLLRNLGVLFYRLGEWKSARTHLERSTAADRSAGDSLRTVIAECCFRDGDYKASLLHYKQAAAVTPGNPDLSRAMGACYLKLDDKLAAKAAFDEAERLERGESPAAKGNSPEQLR